MRKFLIIVVLTGFSIWCYSQDMPYEFSRLSIEDGLPQSEVNCMLQDKHGYMWFGTNEGFARFDGFEFKVFRHDDADPHTPYSNVIRNMYEGVGGDLWIGSSTLIRYSPANNTFKNYPNEYIDKHGRIYEIFGAAGDQLLVKLQTSYLAVFKPKEEELVQLVLPGKNKLKIKNAYLDSGKRLWVHHSKKVECYQLNLPENDLQLLKTYQFLDSLPGRVNFYFDKQARLWLYGANKIWYIQTDDSVQKEPYILDWFDIPEETNLSALLLDHRGKIWAGGGDGLYCIDLHQRKWQLMRHNPYDPYSLSGNWVQALYEDRSGVLWVGTRHGVSYTNLHRKAFNHYYHIHGQAQSLGGGIVNVICQTPDSLVWVGHDKGLTAIDRKHNNYIHYKQNEGFPSEHLLVNNMIYALTPYEDKLIAGGVGLNVLDYKRKRWYYLNPLFKTEEVDYNGWVTWRLLWTNNKSRLWFSTEKGLHSLDSLVLEDVPVNTAAKIKGRVSYHPWVHDKIGSLADNVIWAMYEGSENLWLGCSQGLIKMEPDEQHISLFSYEDGSHTSLSARIVMCIYQDSRGVYWIGTEGGGLNRMDYDPESGKASFKAYRKADGMLSDVVFGILEDRRGCLWLSTPYGLTCFDPDKETFRNYTREDGLPSNEFKMGAYYAGYDGELFFGTVNGLVSFFPDSIKESPVEPQVSLTDFYLFNERVGIGDVVNGDTILKKSLLHTDELVLSYKNNMFSIRFIGLHYASPEAVRYRYKLEGFEEDWHYTVGDKRGAHYMNLPAGTYNFKVEAATPGGHWSEGAATLRIRILPPFWKTWWFRGGVLLLLAGLLFVYIRYRTWLLEKRNRLLKHLVQVRTREIEQQKEEISTQAESLQQANKKLSVQKDELVALNATKDKFFSIISHDLRNPFHHISSFSDLLLERYEEITDDKKLNFLETIKNASGSASDLLDNLLNWSKSQTGTIAFKPEVFNLAVLVTTVKAHIKPLLELKDLCFYVDMPDNALMYADKNMLFTVLRNLLSNAQKYTPKGGMILLEYDCNDSSQILCIKDNGVGMRAEVKEKLFKVGEAVSVAGTEGESGTGLGLLICKEFVDRHRGRIEVESVEDKGTTFVVILPVSDQLQAACQALNEDQLLSRQQQHRDHQDHQVLLPIDIIGRSIDESKPYLLLIDDSDAIRKSIREYFSKDFIITEAADGDTGFQQALDQIPDIVVCDVMMPRMNGIDLVSKLKQDRRTSHIPVILLTAMGAEEDKLAGLQTGADDYLVKPFNNKLLGAKLFNLLANRRRIRDHVGKELMAEQNELEFVSEDDRVVSKAMEIVEENIANEAFSLNDFCREIGLSSSQLHRKMKATTNYSPIEFVRVLRLRKAASMLRHTDLQISEVCYHTGFTNPVYFRKYFKKYYGQLPSEYRKES